MVPAFTSCPPNLLTPSLCPCESRPFVEDPPPFLCAMTHSLFFLFPVIPSGATRLFLAHALPENNLGRAPSRVGRDLSSLLPRPFNSYYFVSLTCTTVN